MFSRQELKLTVVLAICLLAVGVLSYAAYSPPAPNPPLRIMFDVTAGKVLFNHQLHSSEAGYGLTCLDCHHTMEEGDTAEDVQACDECHDPDEGDEDTPKLVDAFHQQCAGCHEEYGAGPTEKECSACHVM